jgi:hypothetical protein
VLLGCLVGAQIGTISGALAGDSSVNLKEMMGGLLVGACLGAAIVSVVVCVKFNSTSPFQKNLDANREALRRKEQESMERHNEFVYYDAGREHHFLYARARVVCVWGGSKKTTDRYMIDPDPHV